jgi:UDP-GlcNAc:undecaprenyl-phosphate GlcNAc-1-phosphate transferase
MVINIWKILLGGGMIGLLISSALMLIVLYRLSPILQSRRSISPRDIHIGQVPRYGGIALFWGFVGSILVLWLLPFEQQKFGLESLSTNRLFGLCFGGLIAWGIGFYDDLFNLRTLWKLVGQVVVALLAISLGFELQILQVPFIQSFELGLWSWPITLLWIVGVMNAVNLIDGLDGLASGLTIVALVFLAIICWWQGEDGLLLLILVLIGTTLGFWSFNRHPALIFMGDSVSLFLGYALATLSIWATESPGGGQSILPLLILAIPLLDTSFSLFRRFLKGIPFYSADKDHLHHRLISKGFSPPQAMLFLVIVSVLFGGLALVAFRETHLQGFVYLAGVILAYLLLYWLEYDVVRSPLTSFMGQNDKRKRRNLMLSLSDNISEFLAKDPDQDSILRSFRYWTDLAGVAQFEVYLRNSSVYKSFPLELAHRIIFFQKGEWEVRLAIPETSWTVDSDIKRDLLERVSMALINRLERLEEPMVVRSTINNKL